jgi:hypothetical protein
MLIIGCDFHTRYQQVAMMDDSTGELTERRLDHQNGEANAFYRSLPGAALFAPSAKGASLFVVCGPFTCFPCPGHIWRMPDPLGDFTA